MWETCQLRSAEYVDKEVPLPGEKPATQVGEGLEETIDL